MGSTGSGSFSDYSGHKGNSNQGGSSDEDKCRKAVSANLEDVANCDYYKTHNALPADNTEVQVAFISPRLAVVDKNKVCIGYLPTAYNYLKICMGDGFSYSGIIKNTSLTPIPHVSVLISPK